MQFLKNKYEVKSLNFWLQIEQWKQTVHYNVDTQMLENASKVHNIVFLALGGKGASKNGYFKAWDLKSFAVLSIQNWYHVETFSMNHLMNWLDIWIYNSLHLQCLSHALYHPNRLMKEFTKSNEKQGSLDCRMIIYFGLFTELEVKLFKKK